MRKTLTLLATTAALTGCGAATASDAEVTYSLESDAPSMLATYATADGGSVGQQQETDVPSPWTKTATVEGSLVRSFVLSGSMNPVLDGSVPDGTTITCRITVDGEVVAEQTSTGQYATVTCATS